MQRSVAVPQLLSFPLPFCFKGHKRNVLQRAQKCQLLCIWHGSDSPASTEPPAQLLLSSVPFSQPHHHAELPHYWLPEMLSAVTLCFAPTLP